MSAPVNRRGRPRIEGLPERRREEILTVATQLFAERGYPDTDVESIAAALDLAKGTLYRYFRSKEEVFLACIDRGVTELHRQLYDDSPTILDPLEKIERAIAIFLSYYADHPELVELFIQERAYFRDRPKPAYFASYDSEAEQRQEFLRTLIDDGRVRAVPGMRDMDVLNDLMYGTLLANRFTGRKITPEEQARTIIEIVFYGLVTDAERRRRKGMD